MLEAGIPSRCGFRGGNVPSDAALETVYGVAYRIVLNFSS